MTPEKARELLSVQASTGGGYDRNAARLILAEVQREHGQEAVDGFIREFDLESLSGFRPGTEFRGPWKLQTDTNLKLEKSDVN
jgi:hypothetical protein